MSGLETTAAWAASAALIGVTLIPLGTFWSLNMRGRSGPRAQPVRMATIFLRIALPIFIMATALAVFAPAVNAYTLSRSGRFRNSSAAVAAVYTALTSSFAIAAASIATTSAVYLSGLSVLYAALGRKKWWKYLRLDAICGVVLLFVLDVAWWARNLVILRSGDDDGISLSWLIIIVDATLCLLAAGVVGTAIYVMPKLKRRTDLAVGNLSALLLSASILWLLRCTFVLSVDLKSVLDDWTDGELAVLKFLSPILNLWVSATVLGLVTFILRNPVWSDAAAIPDRDPQFMPQPGYYPPPQYGYQQQPQMYQQYPHMHQQHYPQQPGMYQQAPELSSTPVPAHRV